MVTSISAKSYGPEKYAEGRPFTYLRRNHSLDPKSKVTYEDDEYELFRSPTDPNKKFTLEDALLSNATVLNI